ncbi:MAG: hypothetical protein Q7R45_09210 [Sulfuricaulis sp.]|nr:hypothetical protein [Sulfuricaulis sp.]
MLSDPLARARKALPLAVIAYFTPTGCRAGIRYPHRTLASGTLPFWGAP